MTPDWIRLAKVGDKVVCVDADDANLTLGETYTIASITTGRFNNSKYGCVHNVCITLKEANPKKGSVGFIPQRFRPIEPRKTDISIFTRLLITAPADQMEEA